MKRTKIVCTIGPSSSDPAVLKQMIHSGMNVARLAFSHGSYESHKNLINNIRQVSKELNVPLPIMQDIQGPRIRIGNLPEAGITVKNGDHVALCTETYYKKHASLKGHIFIPIQYSELYKSVAPEDPILISDGIISLIVEKVRQKLIYCRVREGGVIHNHKGINLPGVNVKGSVITAKDKKDLAFGIRNGIDFVAVSFVKDAGDIHEFRKIISRFEKRKNIHTKIISKIERVEAIKNFDEILEASDGIMVARGDLGIEFDPSYVPILQKKLILKCIAALKPVIVATQMLESMMENPRPTRAEASDVANAVIDHTDATMLSGETTIGRFPVECVRMMAKIITRAERSNFDDFDYSSFEYKEEHIKSMSIFLCSLAKSIFENNVHTIIMKVKSDILPRFLASLRMERSFIVLCDNEKLYHQLALLKGSYPYFIKKMKRYSVPDIVKDLCKNKVISKKTSILFLDEELIENQEKTQGFVLL